MMEYMFFDASLRDRFVRYLGELGVDCEPRDDSMGLVVGVAEDLPEAAEAAIEARYDALMEEQAGLADESEDGARKHLAGFRLDLPDGRSCMVAVRPDIANRLLDCFTLEEIQDLFASVARRALDPQDISLCRQCGE